MKSAARLCWISVACLLLAACPPLQPPKGPPPPTALPPTAALTCNQNSSGGDFVAAKVFKLSAGFDPKPAQPPTQSQILGNVTQSDPYWNDLAAAFTAASPALKVNLCNLDGIFIVQNTCPATGCTVEDVIGNSWGFRQIAPQPKRYIATSATLWQNGTAPSFVDYENMRLQALLLRLDPNANAWFSLPGLKPYFSSASPNTSGMTVLAVLAHEYGHVLWFDKFVVNPDGSPNPGGAAYIQPNSPALFCNGRFYTAGSWTTIAVPSARWIGFGERLPDQVHRPDVAGLLKTDLSNGNFAAAARNLSNIFLDTDLASTLASFSPIEDFVVTYEWLQFVSANPPLTDLSIRVDGFPQVNLVRWLPNKGGVRRKLACFS
jgi:hypothetical protein